MSQLHACVLDGDFVAFPRLGYCNPRPQAISTSSFRSLAVCEGEGLELGQFVTCTSLGRQKIDTQGAVPIHFNSCFKLTHS